MAETGHIILVRIRGGKKQDKELWEQFGLRRAGESVVITQAAFEAKGGTAEGRVVLSLPFDAEADELALGAAQSVTIAATPWPNTPNVSEKTLLALLGVLGPTQAATHQRRIQRLLERMGFDIDAAKIDSGAGKTVAECAKTVQENATKS